MVSQVFIFPSQPCRNDKTLIFLRYFIEDNTNLQYGENYTYCYQAKINVATMARIIKIKYKCTLIYVKLEYTFLQLLAKATQDKT